MCQAAIPVLRDRHSPGSRRGQQPDGGYAGQWDLKTGPPVDPGRAAAEHRAEQERVAADGNELAGSE